MRRSSWWLAVSLVLACAREDGSTRANEASASKTAAASRPGTIEPVTEPVTEPTPEPQGAHGQGPHGVDEVEPAREPAPTLEPAPARDVELNASDGTVIHGRYYPLTGGPSPVVLLFHQAGSNAAEYEPIAPRLQALGFAALAIDQRSGGRRFGRNNRTVDARGESTGFSAAYPDLEAALAWVCEPARGHPHVLAWGSSYTAALVFRLGAEHSDELTALLAFSPGEYLGRKGLVAGWAEQGTTPVFVTSAPGEAEDAGAIAKAASERATHHVPVKGVHGSSMLHPERNPEGHAAIWAEVEAFLQRTVSGS